MWGVWGPSTFSTCLTRSLKQILNIIELREPFRRLLRCALLRNSKFWWISRFSSVFTKASSGNIFSSQPHIYFCEINRNFFLPKSCFSVGKNLQLQTAHTPAVYVNYMLIIRSTFMLCKTASAATWQCTHPTDKIMSIIEVQFLTFWRRIFFLILAHPVFKMWIIQKPNKVALWNKRHFEEKKMEITSMFKMFSTDICWINIKWGI